MVGDRRCEKPKDDGECNAEISSNKKQAMISGGLQTGDGSWGPGTLVTGLFQKELKPLGRFSLR